MEKFAKKYLLKSLMEYLLLCKSYQIKVLLVVVVGWWCLAENDFEHGNNVWFTYANRKEYNQQWDKTIQDMLRQAKTSNCNWKQNKENLIFHFHLLFDLVWYVQSWAELNTIQIKTRNQVKILKKEKQKKTEKFLLKVSNWNWNCST